MDLKTPNKTACGEIARCYRQPSYKTGTLVNGFQVACRKAPRCKCDATSCAGPWRPTRSQAIAAWNDKEFVLVG